MAPIDCTLTPPLLAFIKAVGPTIGIFGAVAAWLINKLLGWCVWMMERFLKRDELMKAILAEISSNSEAEAVYYPNGSPPGEVPVAASELVRSLRRQIGPYKPLAPYVATVSGNPIFERASDSLALLPRRPIKSVVAYYSASVSLTNQLLDFRSDAYLKLSQPRQEEVIKLVWDVLGREVERAASDATKQLVRARRKNKAIRYSFIALASVATVAAIAIVAPNISSAIGTVTQAVEWASSCQPIPKAT